MTPNKKYWKNNIFLKKSKNHEKLIFWKMLKNIEKSILGIANHFLSDFEHGVKKWFFRDFWFFLFFPKESLKTHQNICFQSPGVSKNASPCRELSISWFKIDFGWTNYMFMIKTHIFGYFFRFFLVFLGCKTKNPFFFKLPLQPWDLSRKMRLEKWCL